MSNASRMILLYLFTTAAYAQNGSIIVPAGCQAVPASIAVTCGAPPAVCPPGQTGTPPNCTTPPHPGPPGTITCPGYANTRVLPIKWGPNSSAFSSTVGGFGADDILVVTFTAGSAVPGIGSIGAAEYQGPPTQRTGKLSSIPCDLAPPAASGTQPSQGLIFGTGPGELQANNPYYFNIKNTSCQKGGVCNVIVTLQAP